MPADPRQADKDFMAAPISDQLAYLRETDPQFRDAPLEQQMGYLLSLRGGQGTEASKQALAEFAKTQRAATKGDPQYDAPQPGGTLRQLLRPQNWSLEAIPETLGREVGATGSTINPINWIQGLAEQGRSQSRLETAINPGSLITRPLAEAIRNAAAWYSNAARGKVPNATEQALSVAPEAVGQGAGQALLMRGPIGRLARMAGAPEPPPEAGPLLGIKVRAKAALDRIETTHANTPVDATPVLKIANRALEASERGYTLPKPISDFLDHITKPGQTLTLEAARDFSKAMGEKIPWDQPGAKAMNGFMKQMRGALEEQSVSALKNDPSAGPKVANAYLKAKTEFGKGQRFVKGGQEAGRVVGGYAGYELGRQLGHPLEGMSAGGFFGRRIFGPLTGGIAEQVVNPPILGKPIAATAAAISAARKAATPFVAPVTAPFRQPPADEGDQ